MYPTTVHLPPLPPSHSSTLVFLWRTTLPHHHSAWLKRKEVIFPTRAVYGSGLGNRHISFPGLRDWFWDGHVTQVRPTRANPQTCAGATQKSLLLSTWLADLAEWKPKECWGLSSPPYGVTLTNTKENRAEIWREHDSSTRGTHLDPAIPEAEPISKLFLYVNQCTHIHTFFKPL